MHDEHKTSPQMMMTNTEVWWLAKLIGSYTSFPNELVSLSWKWSREMHFFCTQCIFCPRTESTSETLCIWIVIAGLSWQSKKLLFYKWKVSTALYPFHPFINFVSTRVRVFCWWQFFSGVGLTKAFMEAFLVWFDLFLSFWSLQVL